MTVKTILVVLVLNILLPTLDSYTDINLVVKLYRGAHYCVGGWGHNTECEVDPVNYCSKNEKNQADCKFSSHPKMAIAMLTPILLNYIVCFITFLRKEKNKKFTFIFALLNIYPQFGKNNYLEKSFE